MTAPRVRIRLDVDACVGHGRCYALAPEVYLPDDLGHCEVVADVVEGGGVDRARRAAAACPERAIVLDDE